MKTEIDHVDDVVEAIAGGAEDRLRLGVGGAGLIDHVAVDDDPSRLGVVLACGVARQLGDPTVEVEAQ